MAAELICGQFKFTFYQHATLEKLVDKTIQAVETDEVEGAYGNEPMTTLYFTDGSKFSFVHPSDENDK